MGRISGLRVTSSGQSSACQAARKLISATVMIAGAESGSRMAHKNRKREQPSMNAASSSSLGMPRKNWRNKKMAKTLPMAVMNCAW